MARIGTLIALIRFPGPLIISSATILGMVVNAGGLPDPIALAVGVVSTFSLSGAAFALNDYFDLEIDAINNPERPLPAGLLLPKEAFRLGLFLSLIGIAVPSIIDLKATVLAFSVCIISIYYNFHGKKTGFLGNIMIAFCASATFLYGAVLTSKNVNATAWTIFLLAFLSNSAREVTKSIADAEGDRMGNVRSLAIIHSARTAAITAATLYLLTAIVGPLITRRLDVSIKLLPTLIFLVSEAGFVYSAASILNDTSQENALRVNKRSNIWMMLVLVAIALNILFQ